MNTRRLAVSSSAWLGARDIWRRMFLICPTPMLDIFQLSATCANMRASVHLHFLTARTDHAAVDDRRRNETRSEQLVASKQRMREIKQHKRDKKCRNKSRKCGKPVRSRRARKQEHQQHDDGSRDERTARM